MLDRFSKEKDAQKDKPEAAFLERYILYKQTQAEKDQVLIYVDFNQAIPQFTCCNLNGRLIASSHPDMRRIIAHFLWEQCGEKQAYLNANKNSLVEDQVTQSPFEQYVNSTFLNGIRLVDINQKLLLKKIETGIGGPIYYSPLEAAEACKRAAVTQAATKQIQSGNDKKPAKTSWVLGIFGGSVAVKPPIASPHSSPESSIDSARDKTTTPKR